MNIIPCVMGIVLLLNWQELVNQLARGRAKCIPQAHIENFYQNY